MAEEFSDPIVPESGFSNKRTMLIVLVVLIFFCCCCCGVAAAMYYGIEPVMTYLGIDIPWYP